MTLQAALWVILPIFIAVGSALIAVYIMQQRMEVQLARERQSLSEARAAIDAQRNTLDELNRLREENAKHQSLEKFLSDIRTEQRRFVREQKLLFVTRKCLVVQERIYFRNIPLCNWVEHETPVEEGADIDDLAKTLSVFSGETLLESAKNETDEDRKKPLPQDDGKVVKLVRAGADATA